MHQATSRESFKRPLSEPAESSDRPAAPGDDHLAASLHALQVLAEAVMELADPDFALGPM
jgi:hypothetical protein